MFADLHIHSWYSDSTLSPEEIVEKAKNQNITLISICDHDSVDAYVNCSSSSHNNSIKIIMGTELTSIMNGIQFDILAYGFDIQNKALKELFQYNRSVYFDMGIKLIEKMSIDYPSLSLEEFLKYERNRKNGGWESRDYLRSKGLGEDNYDDFVRAYVSPPDKDFVHSAEVIKIIHNAGGYAVLAHPGGYRIGQNIEVREKIAVQFLDMGIDGFECYFPCHTVETIEFFVKFCRDRDLMITAGSDEHGGFSNLNSRGFYIGAVKVKIEQLNLKNLMNGSL